VERIELALLQQGYKILVFRQEHAVVLERERKAMGSGEEFSTSLKLNALERAVRKVGDWRIHSLESSLQDSILEVRRKLILGGSLT
jgi:hypothetical protein